METIDNINTPSMMPGSKQQAFFGSFKGDKVIWLIIFALSAVSILAVYSASGSAFSDFVKQSVFMTASIFVVYVAHNVPISWYRRLAKLLLYISIVLLILTLVIGVTLNQGQRWINIPFINFTFQPSELAKIGVIVYIAKVLEEGEPENFKKFFLRILLPVAITGMLIMWGSNSAALLLGFTVLILFYVANVRWSYIWKTIGIAVAALTLIIVLGVATPLFPRIETAIKRVTTRVENANSAQDNWQAYHAKAAVATSGILGKGPGNSGQRTMVPNPESDFIYAIIVEEYGIVGASVVLFLYLILLYRAVLIARSCTRIFPMVTVLGLVALIVFQAMLNMGVAVGIFPVTGQTLPLVSAGGSALITTGFALGIVLSISRATEERTVIENVPTNQ